MDALPGTVAVTKFISDMAGFFKAVTHDPRIPPRDKKVLAALLVLVVSPVDLIPDWLPVIGQLDDLMMAALILDYFFTVLDSQVLLSHWPWDMKKFAWARRFARTVGFFAPRFLKKRLWSYTAAPY